MTAWGHVKRPGSRFWRRLHADRGMIAKWSVTPDRGMMPPDRSMSPWIGA